MGFRIRMFVIGCITLAFLVSVRPVSGQPKPQPLPLPPSSSQAPQQQPTPEPRPSQGPDTKPAQKDDFTILKVEPVAPIASMPNGVAYRVRPVSVPTDRLAENMKDFMEKLGRIFQSAPRALGELSMEEVELHLDISAEGQVQVVGVGGSLGVESGIKVTFRRTPSTSASTPTGPPPKARSR